MELLFETPQPSIGVVIGTFAAVPYIHLQLESLARHSPSLRVLVHDDCSPLFGNLRGLCAQFGASATCSAKRYAHFVGDLAAFLAGFEWARQNDFDILVKFSRRFIPMYSWVRELQELAFLTQYATYSSRCIHTGFGFRTECVAMNVRTWFESDAVNKIRARVLANDEVFVEKFIHDLAREVHKRNCKANKEYEKFGAKPESIAAYGDWLLCGVGRHSPRPNVLWHDYTSPSEYAKWSSNYGLPYEAAAYADPNQGFGVG